MYSFKNVAYIVRSLKINSFPSILLVGEERRGHTKEYACEIDNNSE